VWGLGSFRPFQLRLESVKTAGILSGKKNSAPVCQILRGQNGNRAGSHPAIELNRTRERGTGGDGGRGGWVFGFRARGGGFEARDAGRSGPEADPISGRTSGWATGGTTSSVCYLSGPAGGERIDGRRQPGENGRRPSCWAANGVFSGAGRLAHLGGWRCSSPSDFSARSFEARSRPGATEHSEPDRLYRRGVRPRPTEAQVARAGPRGQLRRAVCNRR